MTQCKDTQAILHISGGVYTIPDASRILNLPRPRVQRWVSGYTHVFPDGLKQHKSGIVDYGVWGEGKMRGLNFLALIEVYVFAALRGIGVSSQGIKAAREELIQCFKTNYPLASHKLLSDGKKILVNLESPNDPILMILGEQGQTALRPIIEPFCKKIDFCTETSLAMRYWPLGKSRAVVVDPRQNFGRPSIVGTNISTETIAQYVRAGEKIENVSSEFELSPAAIKDAIDYETTMVA